MKGLIIYSALILLSMAALACAEAEVSFKVTGVVIYPQNTGLLLADAKVPGGGQYSTVLPAMALRDSIRIGDDGGVTMIRARDTKDGVVSYGGNYPNPTYRILSGMTGKTVNFETGRGEYAGTLAWMDESSGIMALENVTYSINRADTKEQRQAAFLTVQAAEVLSIRLEAMPAQPERIAPSPYATYPRQSLPGTQVTWASGATAPHKASISYLSGGLSWKPQFYLDLAGSGENRTKFSFWAQATNSMDANLTAVRLRLVAGNINMVQSGYQSDQEWMSMTQSAVGNVYDARGAASAGSPTAVKVEEYEVYDFPGPADLGAGETQYLPVFDDYVTYEKDYVWDARSSLNWYGYSSYDTDDKEGKVQKIYRVKNEGRTWPYGVVSVFENGMLTGQDTISWTPKGSEAKVTVGYAPDIEVKRRETVKVFYRYGYGSNQDYNHTATLKLKNYKTEAVKVLVMDQFPQNAQNFTASEPYEEKPGNLMYWTVKLDPGQNREITYNYVTD